MRQRMAAVGAMQRMNVACFMTYACMCPHFETELELMQRHLDRGDRVFHAHCRGEQTACDQNPQRSAGACLRCMAKHRAGLRLLSRPVRKIPLIRLTAAQRQELAAVPRRFAAGEELREFRLGNFDAGWAVVSSLISHFRDPELNQRDLWTLVWNFLISAGAVYRSTANALARYDIEQVYVFNGRWAASRAVLRACQEAGVKCLVHDRGSHLGKFALFENTTPHDRSYHTRQMRAAWNEAAGNPERQRIAAEFYEDRRRAKVQSWVSFVKDHKPGLLPEGWECRKRNLVAFSSSEDEFAAIGRDWVGPLYENQIAGLRRLAADLERYRDRLHLYIRLHPNLRGVVNAHTREMGRLASDFVTVISPDSPVSSYALLDAASTVLTFGSTMGIEAAYWGKPSVLLGQSFYRGLGGVYEPKTHEEAVAMLAADLKPLDREPAFMYGYYMNTFGEPFRYFEATGVFEGKFKGVRILHPEWSTRIARRLGGPTGRLALQLMTWRSHRLLFGRTGRRKVGAEG